MNAVTLSIIKQALVLLMLLGIGSAGLIYGDTLWSIDRDDSNTVIIDTTLITDSENYVFFHYYDFEEGQWRWLESVRHNIIVEPGEFATARDVRRYTRPDGIWTFKVVVTGSFFPTYEDIKMVKLGDDPSVIYLYDTFLPIIFK